MEIVLQILIASVAAIGLGFILADVFRIPKYPVSKAITSLGKRKNKKTNPLDIWLGDLANLIASKIRLNEYKRLQLKVDLKIRTNNVIERMNREIRRRTRVVGTFPDGKSALMLVCARLRYVSGKEWGSKRYLCMKYLTEAATEVA